MVRSILRAETSVAVPQNAIGTVDFAVVRTGGAAGSACPRTPSANSTTRAAHGKHSPVRVPTAV
jgi:hypothetical protein